MLWSRVLSLVNAAHPKTLSFVKTVPWRNCFPLAVLNPDGKKLTIWKTKSIRAPLVYQSDFLVVFFVSNWCSLLRLNLNSKKNLSRACSLLLIPMLLSAVRFSQVSQYPKVHEGEELQFLLSRQNVSQHCHVAERKLTKYLIRPYKQSIDCKKAWSDPV